MMKLAPEWTPERDPVTGRLLGRGRLWDFTEMIAKSRREGWVNFPQPIQFYLVLMHETQEKPSRRGHRIAPGDGHVRAGWTTIVWECIKP